MGEFYSKHIGEVYERLTINSVVRNPRPQFVCSCECGGSVTCDVFSILHKKTRSCGCLRLEVLIESGKKNLKPLEIGLVFKNKKGLEFKIVEYVKSTKVRIEFVESGYETWSAIKEIKKGSIRDWIATPLLPYTKYVKSGVKRKPALVVGQILENFYGCKYEVTEILDGDKCKIKFLDSFGYEKVVIRSDAKKGIRNPYRKTYSGVGYIGEGAYSPSNSRQVFTIWTNMLTRCYDEESMKKNITYALCSVDDKWHNFQSFASWCDAQAEFVKNPDWHLDKDILNAGNKVYSPDNCAFVPRDINNLFTLRGNKRGDYPLGVHLESKSGKYIAQINRDGRRICLGRFATPEKAFLVYKEAKESVVKDIAEKYKSEINAQIYTSLINWKVEVTD